MQVDTILNPPVRDEDVETQISVTYRPNERTEWQMDVVHAYTFDITIVEELFDVSANAIPRNIGWTMSEGETLRLHFEYSLTKTNRDGVEYYVGGYSGGRKLTPAIRDEDGEPVEEEYSVVNGLVQIRDGLDENDEWEWRPHSGVEMTPREFVMAHIMGSEELNWPDARGQVVNALREANPDAKEPDEIVKYVQDADPSHGIAD